MGVSSECLRVELELECEYEGSTPPFSSGFRRNCEYPIQHSSPKNLDRIIHRNSPKRSSNVFSRKRRNRWMGTQSTHHSPNHDLNHPHRPPPQRPFVPSLDQIKLSRDALDDEIDRRIRPKLPQRLPDEAEAYVDEILKKRGTLSRAGREQVADKDIARLRPQQWLNDEVINFYGQLILSRSESQKSTTSTPARGVCNGFIEGPKGKGKGKATEKGRLLDVHYFNTFFWPKLTGEGYEKGRLAKWTKKVTFIPDPYVHRAYSPLVPASLICSRRM